MPLHTYTVCLLKTSFTVINIARLALKSIDDPRALHHTDSLCRLDTAGKGLENIVQRRLTEVIVAAGNLTPKLYGFMLGNFTMDAVRFGVDAVQIVENHNH